MVHHGVLGDLWGHSVNLDVQLARRCWSQIVSDARPYNIRGLQTEFFPSLLVYFQHWIFPTLSPTHQEEILIPDLFLTWNLGKNSRPFGWPWEPWTTVIPNKFEHSKFKKCERYLIFLYLCLYLKRANSKQKIFSSISGEKCLNFFLLLQSPKFHRHTTVLGLQEI